MILLKFIQSDNVNSIKSFSFPQKVLIYFLSAFLFAYFAGFTMGDDGLRHIAFAAHSDVMISWGNVFPHSLFVQSYDPWYTWHKILAFYLKIFSYQQVHIAVNTTVLFVFMMLVESLLERYSNVKLGTLGIIVVLSIVLLSIDRYTNMRPDLLSGLYVMVALILLKRWELLFFLTLLYAPLYYLFFLYTGSIGLMSLVLKNYRSFSAVFSASALGFVLHLYLNGIDFLQTVKYLLTDQTLRKGLNVGEGAPLFEFLSLFNYFILVATMGAIVNYLVYRFYPYFYKKPLALFLLVTSVLWLAQVRYFYLLLPLILLYIFSELQPIVRTIFSRFILYYLTRGWHILKLARNRRIFYLVVIPYTALILAYSTQSNGKKLSQELENKRYFKSEKFNNKRILSNTMTTDIYFGLYQNPTIQFIPSCSIGWFEDSNSSMKDIYIQMMKKEGINEKELKSLLDYLKADYYIHTFKSEKQILSFDKLRNIGLQPMLIVDNKIIFKNTR